MNKPQLPRRETLKTLAAAAGAVSLAHKNHREGAKAAEINSEKLCALRALAV
jgi:hypothetical protein